MSARDRFAELWTDYLEGELDEHGLAELRDLLAADEELVRRAADLFQTHRLLGLITEEEPFRQDEFVQRTLEKLPASQDAFVQDVMADVKRAAPSPGARRRDAAGRGPGMLSGSAVAAAVVILAGVLLFSFWPRGATRMADDVDRQRGAIAVRGNVRLTSSAHAKFFGELPPPVGTALAPQREYVLMSGLVELAFPAGASAILEGPAVFRVLSDEGLALDVGQCSVHAPEGAEGFRVETPATRVVDRGTRFSVTVGETSDTEVQVIEGAADIYEQSGDVKEGRRTAEVRLKNGEARRFSTGTFAADAVTFDASVYRRNLPDRIMSYEVSQAADGGAESLKSVTVQRGGKAVQIPFDELIAARVTWFKAEDSRAVLCGGETLSKPRRSATSDRSLVTGVINPGGSSEPLASSPVLNGEAGTPGMAIGFDRPVANGPGADVVLFDLQTFANPPDGDAFHVSPLSIHRGLKTHTIRKYDLTMESPESHDLTSFHVYFFKDEVHSISQLESLNCLPQKQSIKFRGLAVGIDLSDLGYAAGETVEGLFFQDALDDAHRVDPVLIAGLPEMK